MTDRPSRLVVAAAVVDRLAGPTAMLCATHQAVLRERFARRIELLADGE